MDEGRLSLYSRMCKYLTTMPGKPIKHGWTIFMANYVKSGFLFNWKWSTGKQNPLGAPTDTTPHDEDQDTGYFMGIVYGTILGRCIAPHPTTLTPPVLRALDRC